MVAKGSIQAWLAGTKAEMALWNSGGRLFTPGNQEAEKEGRNWDKKISFDPPSDFLFLTRPHLLIIHSYMKSTDE